MTGHLEICLAKLSDMERHIANGEVLGVSLLLEDISEQELNDQGEKDQLQIYSLLTNFLKVSLQLEQLRFAWAERVLQFSVDTPTRLRDFTKLYDARVVTPVVARLKRQHFQVHEHPNTPQIAVEVAASHVSSVLEGPRHCRELAQEGAKYSRPACGPRHRASDSRLSGS